MVIQKRQADRALVSPTVPPLEWKEISRARQSMWVAVTKWDFKVFPSMAGQRWGKWLFQFEGRTDVESLKGLTVTGDIETLAPDEKVGLLFERWKTVPKRFEGYGFLKHAKGTPASTASLGFTLYCKSEALDWVYRSFLCSFGSVNGSLGIEIVFSFPDRVEPGFWKERWREESWNVISWKLVSRASGLASGSPLGYEARR